jgi:hypothetical protein
MRSAPHRGPSAGAAASEVLAVETSTDVGEDELRDETLHLDCPDDLAELAA